MRRHTLTPLSAVFGNPPIGVTMGILAFLALCVCLILASRIRRRVERRRIEDALGRPYQPDPSQAQLVRDENPNRRAGTDAG